MYEHQQKGTCNQHDHAMLKTQPRMFLLAKHPMTPFPTVSTIPPYRKECPSLHIHCKAILLCYLLLVLTCTRDCLLDACHQAGAITGVIISVRLTSSTCRTAGRRQVCGWISALLMGSECCWLTEGLSSGVLKVAFPCDKGGCIRRAGVARRQHLCNQTADALDQKQAAAPPYLWRRLFHHAQSPLVGH